MTIEDDKRRYQAAAQRVQTCIAFGSAPRAMEPKHLRVGIDMSKSDMGGLAKLLIDKGVITEAEYVKAIADQAEIEAADHERLLSEKHGADIKAGPVLGGREGA